MNCPTELKLVEYTEKKLDEWNIYEITKHLCKCDRCLDIVIDMTVKSKKEPILKKCKIKGQEN